MKRNGLFQKTAACSLAVALMAAGVLSGCSKPAGEAAPAPTTAAPTAAEATEAKAPETAAAKEESKAAETQGGPGSRSCCQGGEQDRGEDPGRI